MMYDVLGMVVVLIWASAGTLLKQTINWSSGNFLVVVVAYNLVAVVVLLPYTLRSLPELAGVRNKPKLFGVMCLNGFYDVAVTATIAFCASIQYAIIANYLWPILMVLFHGMLTGRLSRSALAGCAVGFCAILVLLAPYGSLDARSMAGVGFGVLAAVLWALYSSIVSVTKEYDRVAVPIQCIAQAISGLSVLVVAVAIGRFDASVLFNYKAALSVALYGTVVIALAYVLWIYVIVRHADMQKFACMTYLIPVLSIIMASLYFHYEFKWRVALSFSMILSGIFISRRKRAEAVK